MIQSMTGYGRATVTFQAKKIHIEVKSLNSKALDLSTRIAPVYREKEMEIRQMIAKALVRGKVDFSVWIEKDDTQASMPINTAIVESYYKQIKAVSAKTAFPNRRTGTTYCCACPTRSASPRKKKSARRSGLPYAPA